jgi:alkylhydroperoxidase family enzyme
MARISGVDVDRVEPDILNVFAQQIERWGTTLEPYKIYARRPSAFRAVLGMWDALKSSALLDRKLTTLVNRRVAALNGCVF